MRRNPLARLWDVRRAIDRIARFTDGRSLDDYLADEMLRSAVGYEFAIVGEALNQLTREAPDLVARLPDVREAIAMRNTLIHGYREVDQETVWETIRNDLPMLRDRVDELLKELGDQV
jgi:uncharacterized protein with HEPN domain